MFRETLPFCLERKTAFTRNYQRSGALPISGLDDARSSAERRSCQPGCDGAPSRHNRRYRSATAGPRYAPTCVTQSRR